MSNFCQEYGELVVRLESLHTEIREALVLSGKNGDAPETRKVLVKLASAKQNIEELLKSTTTLHDGRELRQIELQSLREIASKINVGIVPPRFEVEDNRICKLDLDDHNDLSDLSLVSIFKNLTELGLCNTAVKDISVLSKLTKLETLYLNETLIEDVSPLGQLTNLEELQMERCPISDMSPLSELTNLRKVCMGGCFNIKDISTLEELPNLTIVKLSGTKASDLGPLVSLAMAYNKLDNIHIYNTPAASNPSQKANTKRLEEFGVKVNV